MFGEEVVAAARRGAFNVALALAARVWKDARCTEVRDIMIWAVLEYVARMWIDCFSAFCL
jgi:hypothetical protein